MIKNWDRILCAVVCPWMFFLLWTAPVHLWPQIHLQRGRVIAFCFLFALPLVYFGLCFASLLFLTRLVWRSHWKKTVRFFATMILFALFLPYTFGPIWIDLAVTRAAPSVMSTVPPEKTWRIRIDEGEKQCYQIAIQKASNPSEITVFQTRASVFHPMRGTWIGGEKYQWNSSDLGTILFARRNGSWNAEPKDLLQEEIRQ